MVTLVVRNFRTKEEFIRVKTISCKVVGMFRRKSVSPAVRVLDTSILDQYIPGVPSAQKALDIFAGEWSSKFPEHLKLKTSPGLAPLYEDFRITWANTLFDGFAGKKILELGPLELGHSYMLHQLKAERIDAVEANTRAFLKCHIVKEILSADRVHLMLGDFVEYLRATSESYDWVVASGVLYHMKDPLELLDLISIRATRILLWTHYYDAHAIESSERLAGKFGSPELVVRNGVDVQTARYEYQDALNWSGFCGGSAEFSRWITKDSLIEYLGLLGYNEIVIGEDNKDHPNGPAILLCAHKS